MKPLLILPLMLVALVACREDDTAARPDPVSMSEEAVGHFCQMALLEHPGPKAQVHLSGLIDPLFFSQVRDAIAYQRMPEQSHLITAIYVSDMGAAASWEDPGADNWIAADDAHYVVGADVTGGMGAPELVPFSDRAAAETFTGENGGTILALAEISDTEVLAPVTDAEADDDADYLERLHNLGQ